MNQVFLTGIVADAPVLLKAKEDAPAHAVFQLCVSHKTSAGAVRRELYPVNAWYKTAEWAQARLQQGARVALRGYLTQRTSQGDRPAVFVEITAEEFFNPSLRSSAQTAEHDAVG